MILNQSPPGPTITEVLYFTLGLVTFVLAGYLLVPAPMLFANSYDFTMNAATLLNFIAEIGVDTPRDGQVKDVSR
ncbi:MAG: hypothetical protein R3E79_55830 [Caldilineaceae bacterium]